MLGFWGVNINGQLQEKLNTFEYEFYGEKLFIQTDREEYFTGDTLWFSAWLTDDNFHYAEEGEKILYLELSSKYLPAALKKMFRVEQGKSYGQFQIPQSLIGGKFTLAAYTSHMLKQSPYLVFKKEITLYNLPVSTSNKKTKRHSENSIPSQNEKPLAAKTKKASLPLAFKISFFPEGGQLVNGVPNRVAFLAENRSGKNHQFTGKIINKKGEFVAYLAPEFNNKGSFSFTPDIEDQYTAKIFLDSGDTLAFELPHILENGFTMQVDNKYNSDDLLIKIQCSPELLGSETLLSVVQRYNVLHLHKQKMDKTETYIKIPKSNLPGGIIQFTLFDPQFKPHCERLVFMPKVNKLNIHLTNKDGEMEIYSTDSLNRPMSGSFALSVTSQSFINDTSKTAPNIIYHTYLHSEIPGLEKDCSFFFKNDKASHYKRELSMLTNAWRKYTWNEVSNAVESDQEKSFEEGFYFNGRLKNRYSKKDVPDNTILNMVNFAGRNLVFSHQLALNDSGYFSLPLEFFNGSKDILIQAKDEKKDRLLNNINLELESNMIIDHSYNPMGNTSEVGKKTIPQKINMKEIQAAKTTPLLSNKKLNIIDKIQKNEFFVDTSDVLLKSIDIEKVWRKSKVEKMQDRFGSEDYIIPSTSIALTEEKNKWNTGLFSILDKVIDDIKVRVENAGPTNGELKIANILGPTKDRKLEESNIDASNQTSRTDPFKNLSFTQMTSMDANDYDYSRQFYRLLYNGSTNNRLYFYVDGELAGSTNHLGQIEWLKDDYIATMDVKQIKSIGVITNPKISPLVDLSTERKMEDELYCMPKYVPYYLANDPILYQPASKEIIISVKTKTGQGIFQQTIIENTMRLILHGFTSPKKFYIPSDDRIDYKQLLNQPTIYWNPHIVTNNNGKAIVQLPFSLNKECKVTINGISFNGIPGYYSSTTVTEE